jgi:hypothetical protein
MAWFAVHRISDGELVSVGSVVAPDDVLAMKGLTKSEVGEAQPDQRTHRWDKATRQFVARVVRDRLQDLQAKPGFDAFWSSLNATQKTQLVAGLKWLLGPLRYRQEDETPELGPEAPEA